MDMAMMGKGGMGGMGAEGEGDDVKRQGAREALQAIFDLASQALGNQLQAKTKPAPKAPEGEDEELRAALAGL